MSDKAFARQLIEKRKQWFNDAMHNRSEAERLQIIHQQIHWCQVERKLHYSNHCLQKSCNGWITSLKDVLASIA